VVTDNNPSEKISKEDMQIELEQKELLEEFATIIERSVATTCYQIQLSYASLVNDPTLLPAIALGSLARIIGNTIGGVFNEDQENTYNFIIEQIQSGIESENSSGTDLARMKVLGRA